MLAKASKPDMVHGEAQRSIDLTGSSHGEKRKKKEPKRERERERNNYPK